MLATTKGMRDAELLLRGCRRPLVIGMGGGGDVVGALATSEPARVYEGLAEAIATLKSDLLVLVDVGGDVIAHGDEPGLRSPLADAVMLAAGGQLSTSGQPVLLGIFGVGCDAELTPDEVLGRLSV